ncbi:MAG: LCP family protein [Dorea sp.]|nr:LCP family protein [Dorea sp.]
MIGKLIAVFQLAVSTALIVMIWNSGMVPLKFILPLGIFMLILFGITFGVQFIQKKLTGIIGVVISLIISMVLAVGLLYFMKADQAMEDVGGAVYKTDNMIVAVKKDDAAKNILDARDYRFGYQTSMDQENNQLMLEDVAAVTGRELKLIEFETAAEEAEALLDGRIDAAIYNEAFMGIIEDAVENYSEQVRILYQYGIETELEQEETNVEEAFHVYISGIDVAGPISTNSRSDVNIIMTVNPNTKQILLTTTPRDYYVPLPGISGEARDKLTHAGIYGVDVSMATLESIYDIDISYYARVNFTSLITIVDALGGVDVNSEYDFDAGGYSFVQGENHLDGAQALAFARERHSFESGDNQRGKNQEAVLTAILQKAMSPAILTSANQILASVSDCVQTNMTQEEMAKFINMQLSDPASWSIESTAATGSGDNQPCFSSGSQLLYVMWPDEAIVGDISRRMKQIEGENK